MLKSSNNYSYGPYQNNLTVPVTCTFHLQPLKPLIRPDVSPNTKRKQMKRWIDIIMACKLCNMRRHQNNQYRTNLIRHSSSPASTSLSSFSSSNETSYMNKNGSNDDQLTMKVASSSASDKSLSPKICRRHSERLTAMHDSYPNTNYNNNNDDDEMTCLLWNPVKTVDTSSDSLTTCAWASDEIMKLKTMFDFADKDRDGTIDVNEFQSVMRIVDPTMNNSEIRTIFAKIDGNGDNKIQFSEFRAYSDKTWVESPHENDLTEYFLQCFGRRLISQQDVEKFFIDIGSLASQSDIDLFFALADTNKDNLLSCEEFVRFINCFDC